MKKGNIITRLGFAALMLAAPAAFAQDIHFTQFDMQPLVVNPAFTGMFYGKVRANAIYRRQWASVTVPYVTYGASVDAPIKSESGGYLAGGLQLYKDQAGDGNLSNFTGLASIAYHKTFGNNGDEYSGSDLAVGLQAGWAQKSIDLSKLYFGDEFVNGSFVKGTSQEYANNVGNNVSYALVNAGISFSRSFNRNFSMILGAGANNLNQPNDAITRKKKSDVGLAMRYTGELGFVWGVSDKLSLRPAVFVQSQASALEMIYGNEFHYLLADAYNSATSFTPAIFVGGWMRGGDATMITAGLEIQNFRVGLGYDYNTSSLNNASNGNGGFEIALRYVAPYGMYGGKRTIPCPRF